MLSNFGRTSGRATNASLQVEIISSILLVCNASSANASAACTTAPMESASFSHVVLPSSPATATLRSTLIMSFTSCLLVTSETASTISTVASRRVPRSTRLCARSSSLYRQEAPTHPSLHSQAAVHVAKPFARAAEVTEHVASA